MPIGKVSNHFAAQGACDVAVYTSGVLRMVALAMGKIASDIRLMGSGPRCGFGELLLPVLRVLAYERFRSSVSSIALCHDFLPYR